MTAPPTPAPTTAAAALGALHGGLVVSCQAPPDDPASGPAAMALFASAAVAGGAVGIRAEGLDDLAAVRAAVDVPLIGLWKVPGGEVYITPTVEHALAVVRTGAQLVAVDATGRPRPDGASLAEVVAAIHEAGAGVLADVATLDQGLAAADAGADAVATTLAGYVDPVGGEAPAGPDLDTLAVLAARCPVPVLAEGRYATPGQVRTAHRAGAWAVVVGTAITRPSLLTRAFVAAMDDEEHGPT